MSTEERRLAAIVFTDIVGLTELMVLDEAEILLGMMSILRPG